MEWLILYFFLGIAVLEMLFQVLVSSRLEKTLTKIRKVLPHSEYPKKITPRIPKRWREIHHRDQAPILRST